MILPAAICTSWRRQTRVGSGSSREPKRCGHTVLGGSPSIYQEELFTELDLIIGDPNVSEHVKNLIRPFLEYEMFS